MDKIPFVKMHGLGNDFIIIDDMESHLTDRGADLARMWCERHTSIGADGLLLITPSSVADLQMHIFNADGSRPEMCGNGIRCVAKFWAERHCQVGREFLTIETDAGPLKCLLFWQGVSVTHVEVSMGNSVFSSHSLLLESPPMEATLVSMGNPHAVFFLPSNSSLLEAACRLGPSLQNHPELSQGVNVECVHVLSAQPAHEPSVLDVVVWERGAGLTQACGTGACAVVAAAVRKKLVPADVWISVKLPGGILHVKASSSSSEILMRGPAEESFTGEIKLKDQGTGSISVIS